LEAAETLKRSTVAAVEVGVTPIPDERLRERAGLLHELAVDTKDPDLLSGRLLRTREVALLFQVSERAVTDWARRGRPPSVPTPGGHRRYAARDGRRLLDEWGRPRASCPGARSR